MSEKESVKRYFRQPGFERFLELLKRQYTTSNVGARGYITLSRIDEQERSALDAFYGTYSPPKPDETKRYSIKKFEQILKESRFGLTVPELLTIISDAPVLTRLELKQLAEAEWERLVRDALSKVYSLFPELDSRIIRWAEGLRDESSPGTRTLRHVYARSAQEAENELAACITALHRVMDGRLKRPVRLPILAAEVTGDAHSLDWKQSLGRLFWWGLTSIHGQMPPELVEDETSNREQEAEESSSQAILIREGYRRGGVADDDLSSQVMVYAPALFHGEREERILTLRQVERLDFEAHRRACAESMRIFMVENPSVFAELVDADVDAVGDAGADSDVSVNQDAGKQNARPAIICGNGQPTTAVIRMLDGLLESSTGSRLYYAGDLDPAGLAIALGLQLRYPEAFRAWHMDVELYLRYADRGIPMTEAERGRLQASSVGWDCELVDTMLRVGVKLHQELWAKELVDKLYNR
ncbi:TIGR02679 domain-containing protein [Paenibacillus sp. PL2-23]|uniref:TIGR02679 domain-containing protein n=1 Tax=Paenibacillus sp. PL2-23 TaxID=2100729 RepID=UPI0030F661DE